MRRLAKMKKKASYFIVLHSFVSNDGYYIEFSARILAGRLQYAITMDTEFNSVSFYDGTNFEDAFDFYKHIVLRKFNLSEAEKVNKNKQALLTKAEDLLLESANYTVMERNHLFKSKPLFLGFTDPC